MRSETSLNAFLDKLEDGSLTEDQEKVFKTIANHEPVTLQEVAEILGRYPNQISGRVTELKNQNLIKVVGKSDGHNLHEVVE